MEQNIADALLDFYQKLLKPEFDTIKNKQAEHDARFSEIFGHFDSVYKRLNRLEDEQLMIMNRLDRMEQAILSGKNDQAELETRVKAMKEQLAILQARLDAVEQELKTTAG